MSFRFPLASSSWDKEEIDAMHRVIDAGMFTMGAQVRRFESDFAAYIGSQYCLMVNSGSSANLLMIGALFYSENPRFKLRRGDEVIVPAVSWSTTYYPLYQYGLRIKFVDVDMNTLNFDLEQLKDAITDRTRLILAVNLLGNPNDFDVIRDLIDSRQVILIEDNCESMGARFNERFTGTFGVMGSFSSFFSHHISTMEGGMVVTDDEELYHIMLSMRAHGWTRDLPKENRVCGTKSDNPFEESFRFVLPGYNLRPLELSGAVGIEQVKRLPQMIDTRRRNAKLFQNRMTDHPDLLLQSEVGESSWFGFSLVIRPGSNLTRERLIHQLNEMGFENRPIVAGNFAKNQVVKYFDAEVHDVLKNAEWIDRHGLFIGNHHFPIFDAVDALACLNFD